MLPALVMFSWLSVAAYMPGLYSRSFASGCFTLYFVSLVVCLIWSGICLLRQQRDHGLITFGLSLVYCCLPALFAASL
jgi:hypothetical protein